MKRSLLCTLLALCVGMIAFASPTGAAPVTAPRGDNDTALVAVPDKATLMQGSLELVDVVANDQGNGVRLTAVKRIDKKSGYVDLVNHKVRVGVAYKAKPFTVTYIITDNDGNKTEGTLDVTPKKIPDIVVRWLPKAHRLLVKNPTPFEGNTIYGKTQRQEDGNFYFKPNSTRKYRLMPLAMKRSVLKWRLALDLDSGGWTEIKRGSFKVH